MFTWQGETLSLDKYSTMFMMTGNPNSMIIAMFIRQDWPFIAVVRGAHSSKARVILVIFQPGRG